MIRSFIKEHNLEHLENVSLKKYNTYRLDTIASYIVFPKNTDELILLLKYIKENNLKYLVLGNGSNIIFKNPTYDGIIIKLTNFNNKEIIDTTIRVGAGYSLIKLAIECANMSLTGIEFASGIPGEIGASAAMNAGAYNTSFADIITRVKVLTPDLEIIELENKDLNYEYRHSFFKDNKDYIIIEVELKLEHGDKEEILSIMEARKERRLATQPLNYPSAGSVFRNPPNNHSGALIEKCGLKGYNLNGIEVSEKHANFIINKNNGTGQDIINLINLIQEKVKNQYDIDLILEQEIIE